MFIGSESVHQTASKQLSDFLPHIQHRILSHINTLDASYSKPLAAYASTCHDMRNAVHSFNLSQIGKRQGRNLTDDEVNKLTAFLAQSTGKSSPSMLTAFQGKALEVKSTRQESHLLLGENNIALKGRVNLVLADHENKYLITAGSTGTSESKVNIVSQPNNPKPTIQTLSQGGEPIHAISALPNGMLVAAGGLARHHLRFYQPGAENGQFRLLDKRVNQPAGIVKMTALSDDVLFCQSKTTPKQWLYLMNEDKFMPLDDSVGMEVQTKTSSPNTKSVAQPQHSINQNSVNEAPAGEISKEYALEQLLSHCDQAEQFFNNQNVPQAQQQLKTARCFVSKLDGLLKNKGLKRINEIQRKIIIQWMKAKTPKQGSTAPVNAEVKELPANGVVVTGRRPAPRDSVAGEADMTLVGLLLQKEVPQHKSAEAKDVIGARLSKGQFGQILNEKMKQNLPLATGKGYEDSMLDMCHLAFEVPELQQGIKQTLSRILDNNYGLSALKELSQKVSQPAQSGAKLLEKLSDSIFDRKLNTLMNDIESLPVSLGQLKYTEHHQSEGLDSDSQKQSVQSILHRVHDLAKIESRTIETQGVLTATLLKKLNTAVLEQQASSESLFLSQPKYQALFAAELASRPVGFTARQLESAVVKKLQKSDALVPNGGLLDQLEMAINIASSSALYDNFTSSKVMSLESLSKYSSEDLVNSINQLNNGHDLVSYPADIKEQLLQKAVAVLAKAVVSKSTNGIKNEADLARSMNLVSNMISPSQPNKYLLMLNAFAKAPVIRSFIKKNLNALSSIKVDNSDYKNLLSKAFDEEVRSRLNTETFDVNTVLSEIPESENQKRMFIVFEVLESKKPLDAQMFGTLAQEIQGSSSVGAQGFELQKQVSRLLVSHLENFEELMSPESSFMVEHPVSKNLRIVENSAHLMDKMLQFNSKKSIPVRELERTIEDALENVDNETLTQLGSFKGSPKGSVDFVASAALEEIQDRLKV